MTHMRPRMGTLLAVTLPRGAPETAARWIRSVFAVASACERVMSRHDPRSELSRLNTGGDFSSWLVSPALAGVLRTARRLAARTEGAFDPTVEPMLDVWRRAARRHTSPSERTLDRAAARVGWRAIDVRGQRVSLAPGAALDLGAIGKGIALDRIASCLRRQGCRSALLNFGESSLLAIGRQAPVVLRHPLGGFAGEFRLDDRACSTSGTHGQTLRAGTRSVSHVIDPRTGRPVTRMAQVTVLAQSATVAEAVSTALLVLGRDAVTDTARRFSVEIYWIDGNTIHATPGFPLRAVRSDARRRVSPA